MFLAKSDLCDLNVTVDVMSCALSTRDGGEPEKNALKTPPQPLPLPSSTEEINEYAGIDVEISHLGGHTRNDAKDMDRMGKR